MVFVEPYKQYKHPADQRNHEIFMEMLKKAVAALDATTGPKAMYVVIDYSAILKECEVRNPDPTHVPDVCFGAIVGNIVQDCFWS